MKVKVRRGIISAHVLRPLLLRDVRLTQLAPRPSCKLTPHAQLFLDISCKKGCSKGVLDLLLFPGSVTLKHIERVSALRVYALSWAFKSNTAAPPETTAPLCSTCEVVMILLPVVLLSLSSEA